MLLLGHKRLSEKDSLLKKRHVPGILQSLREESVGEPWPHGKGRGAPTVILTVHSDEQCLMHLLPILLWRKNLRQ